MGSFLLLLFVVCFGFFVVCLGGGFFFLGGGGVFLFKSQCFLDIKISLQS